MYVPANNTDIAYDFSIRSTDDYSNKILTFFLELKTWAKNIMAAYPILFWANYSIGFVKTIYNPVTALLPSIGCALENGISGGIGVDMIILNQSISHSVSHNLVESNSANP